MNFRSRGLKLIVVTSTKGKETTMICNTHSGYRNRTILFFLLAILAGCAPNHLSIDYAGPGDVGCANCTYKDTVDAGNDPFTPGCHIRRWRNNPPVFLKGDSCANNLILEEYTNNQWHPFRPVDRIAIDCDQECGPAVGVCVVVQNICDNQTKPSAKCECPELSSEEGERANP